MRYYLSLPRNLFLGSWDSSIFFLSASSYHPFNQLRYGRTRNSVPRSGALMMFLWPLFPNLLCPEVVISLILFNLSYYHHHCNLFHVHLPPYRNFEDEIFVRWVDCSTPYPGYVLRYVSQIFLTILFSFLPVCIFELWLLILLSIRSGFSVRE